MEARKFALVVAAAGLLSAPASSHHSFAAEYDASKPVVLKGVVTGVDWTNPHVHFYVDVKDENGNINNWDLETGSPNGLARAGWGKNSLKVGDEVTVHGFMAKDGSRLANARTVHLADGRKVFAGTSSDGASVQEGERK